jgi:hypothetical protein
MDLPELYIVPVNPFLGVVNTIHLARFLSMMAMLVSLIVGDLLTTTIFSCKKKTLWYIETFEGCNEHEGATTYQNFLVTSQVEASPTV